MAAGFPVTIIRPSHTYSQRWIPNLVSSSTYTIAARLEQRKPVFVTDTGENPRTLTATSDFAVGLAGLVGNKDAVGEVFHITSDEALSWNRIYKEIGAALGVSDPEIVPIPTDFVCQTIAGRTCLKCFFVPCRVLHACFLNLTPISPWAGNH